MENYLLRRTKRLYVLIEQNKEEAESVGNDYARLFASFFSRQIRFFKSKNLHVQPKARIVAEQSKTANEIYSIHLRYADLSLRKVSKIWKDRVRHELTNDAHDSPEVALREISDLLSEQVLVGYDERTLYRFLHVELNKDLFGTDERIKEISSYLFRKLAR